MSASSVAFVGALVYKFNELLPILEEHLDDQEGEILPHLFMADLERYAEATVASKDRVQRRQLEELLDFLESAYSEGTEEIQELIAVSFLEHFPRPGEVGSQLRSLVGRHLAKQLKIIG